MPVKRPRESGESNVVDLRIRAPDAAAGDRDLELARQVVEVTVADEQPGGLLDQGRGVANLVCIDACQRAAGDVPRVVPAGAHRC